MSSGDTATTADATLGFVGDVMLGRGVDRAHAEDPPGAVWGDTLPRLDALDGLFLNLECCLSTRGERTPDRGYYFRADPAWAVPALERAGTAWAGLANNHVLDFGEVALGDTLDVLDDAGIDTSGAGPTRREAFEPAVVPVGGLEVAVVAVTDRAPAYAAGAVAPGTAYAPMAGEPLTRVLLSRAVEAARRRDPDLLVVSFHWGPNWVTEPTPRYRDLAHWLVDAGADVVHGHSAHVLQGVEVYRDGLVIHDAGDFVDDYALVGDLHNDRSVLVEVAVADGRPTELRLRPVVIDDGAVHLADGEPAAWLRRVVRERSADLGTRLGRDGDVLTRSLRPTD